VAEAGAEVGDDQVGCVELAGAGDDRGVLEVAAAEAAGGAAQAVAVDLDGRAHGVQRVRVAQALLVDRLVHDRQATGLGQGHHQGLLPVGHEAGVHVRLQGDGVELAARVPELDAALDAGDAPAGHAGVGDLELAADGAEDVEERHHVGLLRAQHLDLAAGGERGGRPAGGLDPVRDRLVVVAVQLRHAEDLDDPVGVHRDDRAHLLQHADEVHDLRLDGRVAQLGHALGPHRGEQHLLGGAHAGVGQLELGAVQPVRRRQVHAFGGLVDHRAELPQGLDVEVDRARPDVTSAQVRDERVAEPVQQRAAEQDRDPARAGVHVDLVAAGALHVRGVHDQLAVVGAVGDDDPVQTEQAADDLHVADARHVEEPAGCLAQQGGHHGLGNKILGATDPDLPVQRRSAVYGQDVVGQRNLQRRARQRARMRSGGAADDGGPAAAARAA
jgi:hypothetical protein